MVRLCLKSRRRSTVAPISEGAARRGGYWRDPERTAEVLSADGWYATGDLSSIDEQGNVRLAGRARELIVLPSGMNVWPSDVEDALRRLPSVQDAAVIPVPGGAGGATLHAYLLPASPADRATAPGDLLARANTTLAPHQRVATASWWDEPDFQRTSTLTRSVATCCRHPLRKVDPPSRRRRRSRAPASPNRSPPWRTSRPRGATRRSPSSGSTA